MEFATNSLASFGASQSISDVTWSLIKSVEEKRRAIDRNEREMAALRNQTSALKAQLLAEEATLERLQSPSKTKLFRTFDLMERIFEYAVQPDDMWLTHNDFHWHNTNSDKTTLPMAMTLAAVCKTWRQTAISSCAIWSTISIECWTDIPKEAVFLRRLDMWLQRSMPRPISISLLMSSESLHAIMATSVFHRLLAHKRRWRKARLWLPPAIWHRVLPLRNLPNLEVLQLGTHSDDSLIEDAGTPAIEEVVINAPSLTHVGVEQEVFLRHNALPWGQLQRLVMERNVWTLPADILMSCRRLTSLAFNTEHQVKVAGTDQSSSHPNLSHLSLLEDSLSFPDLGALALPSVRTLEITLMISYELPEAMVTFLDRSISLEELRIALFAIPRNLLEDLRSSSVTTLTLKLQAYGADPRDCTSDFLQLEHLAHKFPSLQTLYIDASNSTHVSEGAIQAVVLLDSAMGPKSCMPGFNRIVLALPASWNERVPFLQLSHTDTTTEPFSFKYPTFEYL